MKKISYIIASILGMTFLFSACGNNTEFILKGSLGTEKGENILVVYDDPIAKVDTIFPQKGKFEYFFTPDTITLMRLVDKNGHVIPVFADKGWNVTCSGTFEQPIIEGEGPNNDYQDFLNSIKKENGEKEKVLLKVKEFIQSHPTSFASAYVIDQYFIQVPNPDPLLIDSLVAPLSGEVKDSRILNVAMKSIPSSKEKKTHLNYFSLRNRKGEYLTWDKPKGSYILVNYWASWDPKSVEACKALKKEIEALKGQVKVMNISLDYNREDWLAACQDDTDYWMEVCELKGWESTIVKQNHILSLPSNILINNQRKVLGTNLYGESLAKRVDDRTTDK